MQSWELVVVALGGLGDSLLLSPFIRQFHRSGKYARIRCVCRPHAVELFDRSPYVDEVIVCSGPALFLWAVPQPGRDVFCPYHRVRLRTKPGGALQVAVEDRLNPGRGEVPVLKQIARRFHLAEADGALELFTSATDLAAARRIVPTGDQRRTLLVGFKSALPEKDLPDWLRRQVRGRLRRRGFRLVEVDGASLRIGRRRMRLPGIRVMAGVAARCVAMVTVDSFLGHLAVAVGTPAVVLFGPADPAVYGHRQNVNVRSSSCPPCGGTPRRRACPEPVCMNGFSAAEVVNQVVSLTTRRPAAP